MMSRAASLFLAGLLGACASEGDFGRPERGVLHDDLMPAAGRLASALRAEGYSRFDLTDDERELRRRAYTIVQPMRDSELRERLFAEFRHARLQPLGSGRADITSYYRALRDEPFASSEARFSALVLDVRTDADRLEPFFRLAEQILLADAHRLTAAGRVLDLSAREHADLTARLAENEDTIAWVRATLERRLRAYRYALERLAIETPSRRVHAGEVALASLEAQLANPLGRIVSRRAVSVRRPGPYSGAPPITK